MLQDLLVFNDGVLQLSLLNELLCSAENLLFVEAKTKRHNVCGLQPFPRGLAANSAPRRTGLIFAGRFRGEPPQIASRSKLIVRPGRVSPMVTDDYRILPKGSVRWCFGRGWALLAGRSPRALPARANACHKLHFILAH